MFRKIEKGVSGVITAYADFYTKNRSFRCGFKLIKFYFTNSIDFHSKSRPSPTTGSNLN